MKNKAPLALIEQAVMLLVFALAAALCLKAFVWADQQSKRNSERDMALLQAQNAAETLKASNGDCSAAAKVMGGTLDDGVWTIRYDSGWSRTAEEGVFRLRVLPDESGLSYLGAALVEIDRDGILLVQLPVKWQEVSEGE